jgi:hypothetical protein
MIGRILPRIQTIHEDLFRNKATTKIAMVDTTFVEKKSADLQFG